MPDLKLLSTPTWLPDATIKALALRSRAAAMEEVVRKYHNPLLHHAMYLTRNYEEAVDVCQDTFIKAMREPRFFDDEFKIKPWLFRVVSNQCFNQVRNRRRRNEIMVANPSAQATHASQVEEIFEGERQGRILEALARLTPDHQEILTLRYYSDLSYAEIADTLQIALGTVMSRISRAKGRLMEEWRSLEDLAEESEIHGVMLENRLG